MPTNSFSGDVRRRVAYMGQAGACSLRVPLVTPDEGEVLEGRFNIPARLAYTAPHTNERGEFEKLVAANYQRWTEWRSLRGWEVVPGSLRIDGPHEVPVPTTKDESDEDMRMFVFLARFKRSTPLYVGLDDFLAIQDMAQVYGVDTSKPVMPWNDVKGQDSGWVNPLEYAEERRKRMGLKRNDFLLGPLSEPL